MNWNAVQPNGNNYIPDPQLTDRCCTILVTYRTATGRRYVTAAACHYGHVSKQIGGLVTAWQFMPQPYRGR